jgi:hypothetical protein
MNADEARRIASEIKDRMQAKSIEKSKVLKKQRLQEARELYPSVYEEIQKRIGEEAAKGEFTISFPLKSTCDSELADLLGPKLLTEGFEISYYGELEITDNDNPSPYLVISWQHFNAS